MFRISTDYREHLLHFLALAGILVVGVGGWVAFSYDREFQLVLAISLPVAYFVWGVVHHMLHEELYLRVVVEYAAVAILGAILLVGIVLRT